MNSYPLIITCVAIIAITILFCIAHLVDNYDRKTSAQNLYRAARRQHRVRTIIYERGHGEQIVGDVPYVAPTARISDMPRGA